jgi:hypothetical protein
LRAKHRSERQQAREAGKSKPPQVHRPSPRLSTFRAQGPAVN